MKSFLAIAFLIVAVLGIGIAQQQQQGTGKPQYKKLDAAGVDANSSVTRAEAAAVFEEARRAIKTAHIGGGGKSSIPSDGQAVTRDEVIVEMAKIFEASKKSIRIVPTHDSFDATLLKVGSPAAKAELSKLIAWGFVAPVGPLATGPKPTISIQDLGDALGFFISRLSDITHMPSTRWSPYIQHPDN